MQLKDFEKLIENTEIYNYPKYNFNNNYMNEIYNNIFIKNINILTKSFKYIKLWIKYNKLSIEKGIFIIERCLDKKKEIYNFLIDTINKDSKILNINSYKQKEIEYQQKIDLNINPSFYNDLYNINNLNNSFDYIPNFYLNAKEFIINN